MGELGVRFFFAKNETARDGFCSLHEDISAMMLAGLELLSWNLFFVWIVIGMRYASVFRTMHPLDDLWETTGDKS